MSIELQNIVKKFKRKKNVVTALDNVSLDLRPGDFIGLLGPNGAGKTTLTRILATLLLPDAGEAYIDGINICDHKNVRKLISTVFGESGGRSLYYRLSVEENLKFYATLAGVPRKIAKQRIHALLEYFDLEKRRKTLVMQLSTGMKAKVLLIRALIPKPKVLLLDEPTLGFDAESSMKAKELLIDFNKQYGMTILLTSHNFSEVDSLTERIILIDKGKIVRDCAPESFKRLASKDYVDIEFFLPSFNEEIFTSLVKHVVDARVVRLNKRFGINSLPTYEARILADKYPLNEAIALLNVMIVERGGKVFKLQPYAPSLKEAFLAYLNIKKKTSDKMRQSAVNLIS
ncbi:MAG: ABC transporter ATP-binding protein [Candidatus Heimdallarchaeaceae archaeon]